MTTTATTKRKTPIWAKILLAFFVVLLVAAAAAGGMFVGKFFGATEQREVQVIRSITLEQKVVLVRSAITGLKPKRDVQDIFGFAIPWSDRSLLLGYDFATMVGIDGRDVSIERTGDNSFRVAIPDFIVIGTAEPAFSVVNEQNGVLSFVTPEIDKLKLSQEILTDKVVADHIAGLRPLLEEQARQFYTNIVTAIDPDITLEFTFAE